MIDMQKAPTGLGTPGRKLWREIVGPLAEEDLELTPRERQWLTSSCKLLDRVTQLEKIMDDEAPITEGYKGQPVVNGLLNEIRQHHQLIGLLLARLDLDADDDEGSTHVTVSSPALRSVKARAAANKRWGKG
jgi:hypothetical protein